MTDLNLRAARIQLRGLVAAVFFTILIALGITTGAFILSFSVLRDLAGQGMMPQQWAWIFPATVDGAILGCTFAAILLSKISGNAAGRNFFVSVLCAMVCISVAGNAYHAYKAAEEAVRKVAAGVDLGFTPLAPGAAAMIAVIPPLLVLAFTHGIGILIKAIGNAYSEYNELVAAAAALSTTVAESATLVVADDALAPIAVAKTTDWDVARAHVAPETAAPHPVSVGDIAMPVADAVPVVAQPAAHTVPEIAQPDDVADAVADAVAEIGMPVVEAVAESAPSADDVAPSALSAADDTALFDAVADAHATMTEFDVAATQEPEQSLDALLDFIDRAPLAENVREAARLKVKDPNKTFVAIAEETNAAPSTAYRRYAKFEEAARAAGFTIPPLPDLGENSLTEDVGGELDEMRELVNN
ncbi:hypothetical protein ABIC28_005138 [Rhodococcus sp. PvR044]|uniref:DUF2637 domain-containing protein n=1 Tax=Rhodococcus sp. PvR044 TaxID=3156402 RepID=UPI003392329A